MTYYTDKQVANRYGVSRTTPWRWVKEENFPKPRKISKGCTRWLLSDIELWESSQTEGV